jgi:DNA repair exonuclease SbcCD ATPase subunit
MKQITLQSLTLRNWRGEKERTTEFNADGNATYICGSNGLGKSRHFDAFCWLLFGKDSQDRKDFEVRTHDSDGNTLHRCECSVEATLSIDGQQHTIKREFKEQWMKPRGQVEEVFKGNVTECTWDGVPVKVNDFQKRVAEEIIDDTLFKMLTNPRYFTERMKWQQQRECLLQMSGTSTDEEIAASSPEFKQLLDDLNGRSLADFRLEKAAEKKRLKAQMAEIQPRIDQTQKMMPEAEDWQALERSLSDIDKALADIDRQIASQQERDNAAANERKEMQQRIYTLQAEQRRVIDNAKQEAEREAYDLNAERRGIETRLKEVNGELSNLNIDSRRNADRIDSIKREIDSLDKQLDDLRNEWHEINASSYDGSTVCPHCGQPLPEHMVQEAENGWKKHKADLLKMNNERGRSLSEQRQGFAAELAEKEKAAEEMQTALLQKEKEMKVLYDNLNAHTAARVAEIEPQEIAEWQSLQTEIDKLQRDLDTLLNADTADTGNYTAHRAMHLQEADDIKSRLGNRTQIAKAEEEIARLKEQGRELAQQIADIERREYIAAEFSKKKIEDCEGRINGMFETVRFRLFDQTLEGNEFETCIPFVNGVPYATCNTAGQLNAGLDIIRTLCRFNNICAPIFIDQAESVNTFLKVQSQIIFLQVTDDKHLVIR